MYNLEYLRLTDGGTLTDGRELHNTLTEWFTTWYQGPVVTTDWMAVIQDRTAFHNLCQDKSIPPDMEDLFWPVLTDVPKVDQVRRDLEVALSTPPSLHDFCRSVRSHHGSTAPGPTGLTYNMLKAWPDATLATAHACLSQLWTAEATPMWMKWCWLCPKPKDPDAEVTLERLRPLILIEVLRKSWVHLVVQRITACWESHDILSPAQHGFRRGRGTDSALAEFINAREHAEEHHLPLYTSSWDIRHAFDCVSKPGQELSWFRLGAPAHVAHWIAHMDDEGCTAIRSPWALTTWARHRHAGFGTSPNSHRPATFPRDRGTPQGDVSSPHTWAAFFDIPLRALERGRDPADTPLALGPDNTLYPVGNVGYADDLSSLTSSCRGLQRTADIMSTFALLFDLEFTIAKLRIGVFNPTTSQPEAIIIHTAGWTPHTVPIKRTGTIELLGVTFDLAGPQTTQKTLTRHRLASACTIMSVQRAVDSTILTCSICTLARASYTATQVPWTEKELLSLDVPLNQLARRMTKNSPSYPNALLYLPPGLGGLGIPPRPSSSRLKPPAPPDNARVWKDKYCGRRVKPRAGPACLYRLFGIRQGISARFHSLERPVPANKYSWKRWRHEYRHRSASLMPAD